MTAPAARPMSAPGMHAILQQMDWDCNEERALLQVVRAIICWILTVSAKPPSTSFSTLYGIRENWVPLSVRGIAGAAAMAAYYFGLQYLPLGDAVRPSQAQMVCICMVAPW